ncbi:hypothetical protein DID88_003782 [Monilinia fructigena]|uniref:Uncharacterized protein n=1 Tax=Monilinia fructigena TaxID=38457 RepID=A0A395IYE1_9HELO|nr:hypothetical protein DID88_003782 [Monilinia fructigena]
MSRRLFSMSGNFDDPTSHSTSQSPFQTAEQLVQDILQNGPDSNAQISPSGELYRAIERYTQERRAERPIPSYYSPETIRSMSSSERRVERNRIIDRNRVIERHRRRMTLARQQNDGTQTHNKIQPDLARHRRVVEDLSPHKGYTAPVQEGMVFVSGTSNDLLTRTAQYQIHMTTAQARAGRLVALGAQDPECDLNTPYVPPTAQIPSDFTNITSPYQVTMECSSDFFR